MTKEAAAVVAEVVGAVESAREVELRGMAVGGGGGCGGGKDGHVGKGGERKGPAVVVEVELVVSDRR